MRDENNLYLKLLKFAISIILMCLIWMHRMRKGKKPRQHSSTSSVSNLHDYENDCLFSILDSHM